MAQMKISRIYSKVLRVPLQSIEILNNEDKQIFEGVNAWFHPKNAEGKNAFEVIRKKLNKN